MEQIGHLLAVGRCWSDKPLAHDDERRFHEELVVTAIDDRPYFIINQQPDGSLRYDGYLYELWEILTREMGLRYRIRPLLEGGYGNLNENGTWTGLVGELVSGRADVALSWLTDHPDRAAVVDFLDVVPVESDQYAFYVSGSFEAAREIRSGIFASLLKPLDVTVWWTLLAFLLIISAALRVSVRFNHAKAESRRTVEEMTWGSCLFFSFMTLVGQGWASTPRSMAARVATLSSWILGILVYSNYTANLISHLAVITVSKPISSLQEFSEQPGWMFAMEPGIGILSEWRNSSDSFERELFWRTKTGEGYIELDMMGESVHQTAQDHVMTYAPINRLRFSLGNEACSLVPMLDIQPLKTNTYLAVSKGHTELNKALNRMLLQMSQAGIINRLKNRWVKTGSDACNSAGSFKRLALGDLLAVFTLIPAAIGCSVGVLTLEYMLNKAQLFQNLKIQSWAWAASCRRRK